MRLKSRALVWDPKDREEFDWRDKKELGWGLGDLIALSDYLIINESMESELNQAVEQVFRQTSAAQPDLRTDVGYAPASNGFREFAQIEATYPERARVRDGYSGEEQGQMRPLIDSNH